MTGMEQLDAALERLPAVPRDALALAGRLAAEAGHEAYLVGGSVRDLFMQRPIGELDVAIVGDAIAVGAALASAVGGQMVRYAQFATATVRWNDVSLDLVTARAERYPRPGALPEVSPGTIEDDLRRRDFTISALALGISPTRWGQLIDPLDGLGDLRRGLVRVLHDHSFQDDATRVLRAVRYEQRLGFTLAAETERWLQRDLPYLDTISGDRLRHELDRWWPEECPERAFSRAEELGVWDALCSGLFYGRALDAAFAASRGLGGSSNHLRQRGLALWTWTLQEETAQAVLNRLRCPLDDQRACYDVWLLRDRLVELPKLPNSGLARLLNGLHPEAVTAAWLLAPFAARARIEQYRHSLRQLRPTLRAPDLERLGVPRGPAIGQVLQRLQDARWDGLAEGRDDEERLVLNWLLESGGAP